MSTSPRRLRVALPDDGDGFPRAGKIALGHQVPLGRNDQFGKPITRPVADDHFVVSEKDSTSADAVAAFTSVYPGEPRELRCMLPGRVPEDVLEGAWRLHGGRKLKRRCDGTTCAERTATGGWETKGCVCAGLPQTVTNRKGEEVPNPDRCKLTWTLWVILPDVPISGVWQIDTGSEIGAKALARWLRMMHTLRGDLALLEFTLGLRGVDVAPDGKAKTVWVLDPRGTGTTPRALIAEATARGTLGPLADLPALPAPTTDEVPDGLTSFSVPQVDAATGEITEKELEHDEPPGPGAGIAKRAEWVASGTSTRGDTPMDRLLAFFPEADGLTADLIRSELRSRGITNRGDLKREATAAVVLAEAVVALATGQQLEEGEEVSGEVVPEEPRLPLPDGAA